MSGTILLVDDHATNREFIRETLEDSAYRISEASTALQALEYVRHQKIDLVITDVRMPGISGVELLKRLHSGYPNIAVILVTAFASVANAVEAMKLGAHSYLGQPLDIDELRALVDQVFDRREEPIDGTGHSDRVEERPGFESILGRSKALLSVLDQAKKTAQANSTVLIQGETGTGKDLLARGIHVLSARKTKPFLPINCGAIPKDLMESELFGHVRGAFTGAVTDRRGLMESANGGTVLLDEIAEMPLDLQVKLLRFLQNGEIRKLGAVQSATVDVRVIAATHRDIAKMVREGTFREDLYYRINIIPLKMPNLRDRREDIPELLRFFLDRSCSRHGRRHLTFDEEVLERFLTYGWPGNIRELENAVERIVVLNEGDVIRITDLPEFLQPEPNALSVINLDLPPKGVCFDELEKEVLLRALHKCDWNQSRVARYLRLSRKTVAYRVHKYNLMDFPRSNVYVLPMTGTSDF